MAFTTADDRPSPHRRLSKPISKKESEDFFAELLDDESEARFWRYFMTGYVIDQLPNGAYRVIPIPLDSIMWAAFKRAVEYKRGMPVQPVAARFLGTVGVEISTNVNMPKDGLIDLPPAPEQRDPPEPTRQEQVLRKQAAAKADEEIIARINHSKSLPFKPKPRNEL